MHFKYHRDPEKTRKLLDYMNGQIDVIRHTISKHEPEYDPNDNLAFIIHLLSVIRQEGSVFHCVVDWLADIYGTTHEDMYLRLEGFRVKKKPGGN